MARAKSVVVVRYVRKLESALSNLKYIGFRSRELDQKTGFFTATEDETKQYKEFYERIKNHKALKHDKTVKAHTIVLSFTRRDFEALARAGKTPQDMAREWMKTMEEFKEMKLDWLGSFHDSPTHPHIHLTIRSVGEDDLGHSKRLKLTKEDIQDLRRILDANIERNAEYDLSDERTMHFDTTFQQLAENAYHQSLQGFLNEIMPKEPDRIQNVKRRRWRKGQQQNPEGGMKR